jgi:hypothetical protein
MSSRVLLAEVRRAEGERSGEIRRRVEGPAAGDRLESRLDPEVRRQLEAIRRGEADTGVGEGEGPGPHPTGEPPPQPGSRPDPPPPERTRMRWRRLR